MQAHTSIGYRNDSEGNKGVYIDPDVVKEAAAQAITANLRRLGPSVLPWSEMARLYLPLRCCCFKFRVRVKARAITRDLRRLSPACCPGARWRACFVPPVCCCFHG